MGISHSGEESGVHADSRCELHEPRHRGTLEVGSLGGLVLLSVDILHDYVSGCIDKVAVEVGGVLLFFFTDLELSHRGVVPFLAGGNGRDADQLA